MRRDKDRVLSLPEAAGLIYATPKPTPTQILRVKRRLQCGVLEGARDAEPNGRWTTTAQNVAQYMAAKKYGAQLPSPAARLRPELRNTYQQLLADYFRAVIFRKRATAATRRFRCAVVAGQAALLALLIAAITLSLRPMLALAPAEQRAVTKWLDANAPEFQVTRWFPPTDNPNGPGCVVRVQYRYQTPRGRAIHTDRRFLVQQDRVVEVDSDW